MCVCVCVCTHVCENDVSEWERKKSLFISVMKRVSMGLKREMREEKKGIERGREGETEDYFKSITLSNCQCCRREKRRGSREPGREEMEEWILSCDSSLYWVELNLSQLASKQIILSGKSRLGCGWCDQTKLVLNQLAWWGQAVNHPRIYPQRDADYPSVSLSLSLSLSLTYTHTHTLDHHARDVPFRAAWFISPLRMRIRQLSVIALV